MPLNYREVKTIEASEKAYFSDSEHLCYLIGNELYWMNLKSKRTRFLGKIENFKGINGHYLFTSDEGKLIISELPSLKKIGSFNNLNLSYPSQLYFNANKELLLIKYFGFKHYSLIDLKEMKIMFRKPSQKRKLVGLQFYEHKHTDLVFKTQFTYNMGVELVIYNPIGKEIYEFPDLKAYLNFGDFYYFRYVEECIEKEYAFHFRSEEEDFHTCDGDCYSQIQQMKIQFPKKVGDIIVGFTEPCYYSEELEDSIYFHCLSVMNTDDEAVHFQVSSSAVKQYDMISDDGKYIIICDSNEVRLLEKDDGKVSYHGKFWKTRDLVPIKNGTGEFKCNRTLLYEISDLFRSLVEEGRDEEIEIPDQYEMKEVERVLTLRLENGVIDEENEIARYFIL